MSRNTSVTFCAGATFTGFFFFFLFLSLHLVCGLVTVHPEANELPNEYSPESEMEEESLVPETPRCCPERRRTVSQRPVGSNVK